MREGVMKRGKRVKERDRGREEGEVEREVWRNGGMREGGGKGREINRVGVERDRGTREEGQSRKGRIGERWECGE